MMKKWIAVLGSGVALVAGAVAAAPAAQAATGQNGVCETGEFCLYYNSDHAGSMVDLAAGRKDYGSGTDCVKFLTTGSGKGQCVKNNTASVWNREGVVVTVFYKSNWSGAIDSIAAGDKVNLDSRLKNNNAGHVVGVVGNNTFEYGVYHTGSARVTAWFDGYLQTAGRHEGIDVAYQPGAHVYAMLNGVVTRRDEGGGGLSTLAVYNAGLNKTVIYLHLDPRAFSVGDSISRGQHIGFEAARGAGSAHTHVELRDGKQTHAQYSSDSTLANSIPTQFWMDRGYNACCQ